METLLCLDCERSILTINQERLSVAKGCPSAIKVQHFCNQVHLLSYHCYHQASQCDYMLRPHGLLGIERLVPLVKGNSTDSLDAWCYRSMESVVRVAALSLMAKVVTGLGATDRTSLAVQTDALKFAVKAAKESSDSSASTIRTASAGILRWHPAFTCPLVLAQTVRPNV